MLLRTTGAAPPTGSAAQSVADDGLRNEVSRILERSLAAGGLSTEDRSFLTSIQSQRTSIPQDQAAKKVDEVYAQVSRSAAELAETARRGAVLTGFVTAAGLLIALAAAWWAAQRGGHHRDNAIPAAFIAPRGIRAGE
jgi:hypothetical protein